MYKRLKLKKTLKPSVSTNSLFSELVSLALSPEADAYNGFPDTLQVILHDLHQLSGLGETELEFFWAKKIAASAFPSVELEKYPYYHNYEQLTQLEYQSLRVLGERRFSKVLFVGSGPLPLTAILLARHFGFTVTCIDRNEEAVAISKKLIEKLNLDHLIEVVHIAILDYTDLAHYDLIFLAALVGYGQQEKLSIIDHLHRHSRPGALAIIRTAHGGRRLLYPFLDERLIKNFLIHAVIEPKNEVVNSIIIVEKMIGEDIRVVINDKVAPQTFKDFSDFALRHISQQYKFHYNPIWHHDLDRAFDIYHQPGANLLVAYAGNEVVGTAALRSFDLKYKSLKKRYQHTKVATVWRFFIKQEYQHTSLVEQLHDKIEKFARSKKYQLLYTHDQVFVPGAVSKYTKLGYVPIHDEHDQLGTIHLEKQL